MKNAPIRVMIVDDSSVTRGLLLRAFKKAADIEVVNSAGSALIAIEQITRTQVDVVLLDIEMPEIDGITVLPHLLEAKSHPKVIMVATMTERTAKATLQALALGASDFIAKPTSRSTAEAEQFYEELTAKIRILGKRSSVLKDESSNTPSKTSVRKAIKYPVAPVHAIAIGCSTGGPQALQTIFKGLNGKFPHVPVFITQHMPATFTTILAQHVGEVAGRPCAEGRQGEKVQAGYIYLAPGNYHMTPAREGEGIVIRINQKPEVNFCRPAVDPMVQALTPIYGRNLLVVILTGIGSDGLAAARGAADTGATIIAQDEQSSVIWGMPRAVVQHNLCSAVLPIDDIAPYIIRACG